MTDASFLNAIQENASNDTPRLIYADWLEEHGEPDRAAFIRVQCALAAWPANDSDVAGHMFYKRRERELREDNGRRWARPLANLVNVMAPITGDELHWMGNVILKWEWSRGFISSLACTLADLMAHAAAIGTACPALSAVRLTDREPLDNSGQRHGVQGGYQEEAHYLLQWWGGDPDGKERRHRIPREIMLHLFKTMPKNRRWHRASERTTNCFFETTDAAESALSRACSAYARGAAGFPTRPHATDIP